MDDHTIKKRRIHASTFIPERLPEEGEGRLFLEGQHLINTEGGRNRAPPFHDQRRNDRCRQQSSVDAKAAKVPGNRIAWASKHTPPPISHSLQRGKGSFTRARSGNSTFASDGTKWHRVSPV